MEPRSQFEQLVALHGRYVLLTARSVLRDEHLGDDAAQEAFVRLWRALTRGQAPRSARAWLRRAAVCAAFDLQRRRAARPLELTQEENEAVPSESPEDVAGEAELAQRLAQAVAALPDGQRTIFLLRHEGGQSLAEVAEALDLALPTVKTQFARACLKLQSALRAYQPDPDE